jgi:hypothetical protein
MGGIQKEKQIASSQKDKLARRTYSSVRSADNMEALPLYYLSIITGPLSTMTPKAKTLLNRNKIIWPQARALARHRNRATPVAYLPCKKSMNGGNVSNIPMTSSTKAP